MRALVFLNLFLLMAPVWAEAPLERIGFGSCAHQAKPQPIWRAVYAERPDLFLMLGDNIYGDTLDMKVLASKYQQLGRHADFALLKRTCPVLAVWDDHDYGANDGGRDFPQKEASRRLMLSFFEEPAGSERWHRPGIYASYVKGPPGRRVQVILLDTRWNRTPLLRLPVDEARALNAATGKGPYLVNSDSQAEILGDEQWRWLAEQLTVPAELRLLCSSIPILQEDCGWEAWENFPHERQRLFRLLNETRAHGVILLSGDSHRAEFSRVDDQLPYPLWELNASGLTENALSRPPNKHRLGEMYAEDNFGLIRIDWNHDDPQISLEVRAADNDLVMQNTLRLSELRGGW